MRRADNFIQSLCADSLEIWKAQSPGDLRDCPGLNRNFFTFYITMTLHRCEKWCLLGLFEVTVFENKISS